MKSTIGQEVSHEGFLDYLDSKIPDFIKKIRDEKDIDKMSLQERGLLLQCEAIELEVATLRAENAHLAAIFRAMTIWLEANEPGVFSRGIWDAIRKAEEALK